MPELRNRGQGERLVAALPWVLALVLAGALFVALFRLDHAPTRSSDPSPLATESPSSETTPREPDVHLRVTADPPEATIVIDGLNAPHNPLHAAFHSGDAKIHLVEVWAPDHQPEARHVRMDHDQDLFVKLRPIVSHGATPALESSESPSPGKRRPASKAATTAMPMNDCEPPYFFDERGVKKFKARCL